MIIAHDFCFDYGGAERVSASIASCYPEASFVALVGSREVAARIGVADRFTSILPYRRPLSFNPRLLAPIYPAVVSTHRLPATDLLLSSSYAFAHGLRTKNDAPHLCYGISPLRFAWSMNEAYRSRWGEGPLRARAFDALSSAMRAWDKRVSTRVDTYLAVSNHVAAQIERFYDRSAQVLPPPVDTKRFRPSNEPPDEHYLFSGRLIEPYKKPTLVVEAFRRLPDLKLRVAGSGPELERLRAIAPENVEFLGRLDDEALIGELQSCAAVVFPSEDDFGLVPIEAMACGRPVLAYGGGGALETVVAGHTGEFFERQTQDCLIEAIEGFDPSSYDALEIRQHAEGWGLGRFRKRLDAAVSLTRSRA